MRCPTCGGRPLSFTKFLVTVNPLRITCQQCGAKLRAGPMAYVWTGLHLALGPLLVLLHRALRANGAIQTGGDFAIFIVAILAFVLLTAYVVPWIGFNSLYRIDM